MKRMMKLLSLILLLPILACSQTQNFQRINADTIQSRTGSSFVFVNDSLRLLQFLRGDSTGFPASSQSFGSGRLIFRGDAGIFWQDGNSRWRLDTSYAGNYVPAGDSITGIFYITLKRLQDSNTVLRTDLKRKNDSTNSDGYLPVHRLSDSTSSLRTDLKRKDDSTASTGYLPVHRLSDSTSVLRTDLKRKDDSTASSGYLPVHRLADSTSSLRTDLARKSTTITVAANTPLSSSAGAQDLSANRTWTLSADTSTMGTGLTTLYKDGLKNRKQTWKEVDGAPSVTDVDTVEIDQTNALTLTNPSNQRATLSIPTNANLHINGLTTDGDIFVPITNSILWTEGTGNVFGLSHVPKGRLLYSQGATTVPIWSGYPFLYSSATNLGFGLTDTSINKNISTTAQSADTSAINFSFTNTGKPQMFMRGITGNNVFDIDSLGNLGIGTASASANRILLTNNTVTTGAGALMKNSANYSVTVDTNTTLSLLEFTKSNLDARGTGTSEFAGLKITTADSGIDNGEGICVVNNGRADGIHLNTKGIAGNPTNNQPTGLGIDLNRNSLSENATSFSGYGIQIYDWSSTDSGTNGAHGIYLKKQNNPNSGHRLFWAQGNNNLIYLFGPGGAGFDATKPIIEYDTTGTAFWKLTAGGDVYQPIGKYGLGTSSPEQALSIYKSASLNSLNMTATNININTSSAAQATDTASTLFSFTNTGKPILSMTGIAGNRLFDFDSGGVFRTGTTNNSARLGQTLDINATATLGGAALSTWSATASNAPLIDFNRSRSATIGTHSVVQYGDLLGYIQFRGSDGTAFQDAAGIRAFSDSVAGTNDMPGRLAFFTTANGSNTLTQRISIDNAGAVTFNAAVRGSDAFTTTATTDTVIVSGAFTTDYYFIQLTGTAAPVAADQCTVEALVGKFVLHRSASGTSGLTYNWFRIK